MFVPGWMSNPPTSVSPATTPSEPIVSNCPEFGETGEPPELPTRTSVLLAVSMP
jgi:hypothetical protein